MTPGKSFITGVAYWPGNPTNVSMSSLNIPTATLVIDYTNKVIYLKTSTTDNSAFNELTNVTSGTITLPTIADGLLASGSVANNFGGSTGTFITSSGANTISGTATLAANKNLLFTTGTSALDLSLGTGVTKTTTGLNTIGGPIIESNIQSLSGAGAVNLTTNVTKITSTGADALTLADGTNGQKKTIVMIVDGGDSTLTPTTKTGFSTIVFNDIGDAVQLQFFTTVGWICIANNGATIS